MIPEILIAVMVPALFGALAGYLVASRVQKVGAKGQGLTATAQGLDAALAEVIERRKSFEVLHMQVLIHVVDALERIAAKRRRR